MSNNIICLLSHDSRDEKVAIEIRLLIEGLFPNITIYVSTSDLIGGEVWVEKIKTIIKECQLIISLITKNSLNNHWVYFESGAGFVENKTIPLLTDGITLKDLRPPLSLLQARIISTKGLLALISDIANKSGIRQPSADNKIPVFIQKIEGLLRGKMAKELKSFLPKNKYAPHAINQWIYEDNCLVFDYKFKNGSFLAIDTYFYLDRTEIQIFERSGVWEQTRLIVSEVGLLDKPIDQYDIKGHRIIFEVFETDEVLKVQESLIFLLRKIEDTFNKD